MIDEKLNIAFLGIGSNVGDRFNNIKRSIKFISELDGCYIEAVSSLYETSPFGDIDQQAFLNAVIKISTSLNPLKLFSELKEIEKKLGRIPREKWGSREIDLDILFFNNLIFSDEIITLPHKGIINRDFVMIPLIEIEPEIIHPVFEKKVSEFIVDLKSTNILSKRAEQLFTEEKYLGI
ncbi:MAG: 2-amino-4-hydroxy-6-hydroxymethyldihydropteridine diphosphokinase [Ignavibacteria bacterium]|nr:2-amino-4-hydroxy-6-hydroxymethyldihydropteridine diphosphokinase [Ignavibacteria bacterium]